MDIKKYETLINLVINEDQAQARELFHEIVIEKSREIFESIMAEEEDEGMGGQVGDLLDEIGSDETGIEDNGDEDDFGAEEDFGSEDDDGEFDNDLDGGEDEFEGEEVEDAVIRIEDKLDQLMAEFEEIMGSEDEEFSDHEEEEDFSDPAGAEEEEYEEDDEDVVLENINLQKVSVTHGDDGENRKTPTAFNSGQAGMDSKPVRFSGSSETVPTGPKAPKDAYTKGEGELPGAGKFKNVPGKNNANLDKAPAAAKKDGASGTRSPVAESRRPVRRPIKR